MSGAGNVGMTITAAVIVNAAYDLQHGKAPTVTIIAGGATGAILVMVGSASGQWEIVEALAVVILVASLYKHGAELLGIGTALGSASQGSSKNSNVGTGTRQHPVSSTNSPSNTIQQA